MPKEIDISKEEVKIVLKALQILQDEVFIGGDDLPSIDDIQALVVKISGKKM